MPTVLRIDGYRFFFYSNEGTEPPHIHVQNAERLAKFWLDPIRLASNIGYNTKELKRIETILREHQAELLEAWHGYFPD
jgi:hypothetical protein